MTLKKWLTNSVKQLEQINIQTATLDALLLCVEVLKKSKSWVLTHDDHILSARQLSRLNALLQRRMNHEPLAYIVGKSEFYGREFNVSADTLQPRPETETMVEMCLTHFMDDERGTRNEDALLVDLGTGSGCIAITIALELARTRNKERGVRIVATDISMNALTVAKRNARHRKANVDFYQGNLLEPILPILYSSSTVYILANLPYVPESHTINQAAMHEPSIAIFGGEDGLMHYKNMFEQLTQIHGPITIYTESLPPQQDELQQIAQAHGFVLFDTQDLIQAFRKNTGR